jgi:hypothetical protein
MIGNNCKTSLLIIALISCGCRNDIELNTPYRETAVVYGLLDAGESKHYIRISRAVPATMTQAEAAQNEGLFFDSLEVSLTCTNNGKVYSMSRIQQPKEEGEVRQDRNDVWVNTADFIPMPGTSYLLHIRNPMNGNTFSSSCTILGWPKGYSVSSVLRSGKQSAGFETNSFCFIYDVLIRINYTEEESGKPPVARSIDCPIASNLERSPKNGDKAYSFIYSGSDVYKILAARFAQKPGISRTIVDAEFRVVGGGEEMRDLYLQTKPTLGIVEKNLDYSNITNGLGIFASRNTLITGMAVSDDMRALLRTIPGVK